MKIFQDLTLHFNSPLVQNLLGRIQASTSRVDTGRLCLCGMCWPVSAVRSSVGRNLAQTYFTTLALSGEPYLEVFSRSFSLSTVVLSTFQVRTFVAVLGCPVLCGISNSTPGFFASEARSTVPFVTISSVSRHGQMSPGKKNHHLRTAGLAG